MKKIVTILLIAMLLFSNTFVYAVNKDVEVAQKVNAKQATEKKNNYFNENELLTLAEYYVNQYLLDYYNSTSYEFSIDKKMIKLYDNNDNHIAYIVKFNTSDNKHVGYLTLGALRDSISFFEISESEINLNKFTDYENKLKKENLIFVPPMGYYLQSNELSLEVDKSSTTMGAFDSKAESEEVEPQMNYTELYNSLTSPEFEAINNQLLERNFEKSAMMRSSSYPAYLSKWTEGQFVPIIEDGSAVYGGKQKWLGSRSSNGCGPTAASNILYYLADKDSKYSMLYSGSTSERDFTAHLNSVYDHMRTVNPIWGLVSITSFANYTKSYAEELGYPSLNIHKKEALWTKHQDTIDFIKEGLNKDTPVATLNLNRFWDRYGWHWMTITAFKDLGMYNNQIVLSSWGEKHTINFWLYFDKARDYGGGYVYFD